MAYQGLDSEDTSQPQTSREESRVLESATRTIPLSKFFVSSDGSEDEDDDFIISSPNGELDYLMSDFNDATPSIWRCLNFERLGQMILLCECNFKSPSRESGPTKVRWMVGPYWNMLIVTYSILLLISVLIYGVLVPRSISFFTLSIGLNLTITTFVLLTMTACRDPGIFPRHTRPLESDWTYSGQAGSFRPPKTIYCKETELLIEGYDHFCPWSGTVIGEKNLWYFKCFIACLFITMLFDSALVIGALLNGN